MLQFFLSDNIMKQEGGGGEQVCLGICLQGEIVSVVVDQEEEGGGNA